MDKNEKREEIYANLKQFVVDIIGREVVEMLDVTPKSVFTKDLEMDSIEIVSFAEKVRRRYGKDVNFESWFLSMNRETRQNLSFENVINFIVDAKN